MQREMVTGMKYLLVASVAVLLSECESPPTGPAPVFGYPTAPVSTWSPSSAPAPPPGPSEAHVVITSFALENAGRAGSSYWYYPNLILRETSGGSHALITKITITVPDDTKPVVWEVPCMLQGHDTIPAAGTWSLHEQVDFYCAEGVIIEPRMIVAGRQVTVSVEFTDRDGRVGSVAGMTTLE